MARRPKQKLLTAVSTRFDPDFIERLSRRYSLAKTVQERRDALEAHWGGGDLSYVQRALVKRVVWLELIVESYELKIANGEPIDIGALTQVNTTLRGHYREIGIKPPARPILSLYEVIKKTAP